MMTQAASVATKQVNSFEIVCLNNYCSPLNHRWLIGCFTYFQNIMDPFGWQKEDVIYGKVLLKIVLVIG